MKTDEGFQTRIIGGKSLMIQSHILYVEGIYPKLLRGIFNFTCFSLSSTFSLHFLFAQHIMKVEGISVNLSVRWIAFDIASYELIT